MKVKGLGVKSIPEYVKRQHKDRYIEWLNSLPAESKIIMQGAVAVDQWYSVKEAIIQPSLAIADMFFNGDVKKAAWTCGRYSAELSLTGIYKIYVQLGSAQHIISRASRIMSAYYDEAELVVTDSKKNYVNAQIIKFPEPHIIVEYRIAGWIEKALEISGCKNTSIEIPKSLTKRDKVTEFVVNWT